MIPEWLIISCGIIIVCAFGLGLIIGVKMAMDFFTEHREDDDYHV